MGNDVPAESQGKFQYNTCFYLSYNIIYNSSFIGISIQHLFLFIYNPTAVHDMHTHFNTTLVFIYRLISLGTTITEIDFNTTLVFIYHLQQNKGKYTT